MNDNIKELTIEELQAEIEKTLQEDAELLERHQATIAEFARFLEEDDPHEDEPLRIEDALCLPELGGKMMLNIPSTPSNTVTKGMVREAIHRGQLAAFRPNKNLFVTRRYLKEWIESCRVDVTNLNSGSSLKPETRTAQLNRPSGPSNSLMKIRDASLGRAQDLARAKVLKLRNTLRNG
ncbi:hypothetical protein AB4Z52_13715 [Rhizobium sp. 2YAF20]|uniref:hypothetical protein n=1 Tax=Rhizobium sp. 2YAF20 TaxID=3233027 RepID=UPI003F94FF00